MPTNEIEIKGTDRLIPTPARYTTKSFTFPGGELQVQIPGYSQLGRNAKITLLARIQSSEDLVRLLLTKEIIDRLSPLASVSLTVPYFPYARQDRVMQNAEAFSLKIVARLINSLGFDSVKTYDVHSNVTAALVDRIEVVDQSEIIEQNSVLWTQLKDPNSILVAPDAGALKKTESLAVLLKTAFTSATKHRDIQTGEITGTTLNDPTAIKDRHVFIVDDICDGGRTFIELAKRLREAKAGKVSLYVTHGIFSKGLSVFDKLINDVYTTDTFHNYITDDKGLSPSRYEISPIANIHKIDYFNTGA